MTLSEFKAWFEGYTEGLESAPTKAQFERIKEKVKEISGEPVTERVFIDRYWSTISRPWSPPMYTWLSAAGGGYVHQTTSGSLSGIATAGFNSADAMYALGKAEAAVN